MTWDSREKEYESQIAALQESLAKVAADLEKSLESFQSVQDDSAKTQLDLQRQLSNLTMAIHKVHENDATLDAALAQNVTLLNDQNVFLQRRYQEVTGDIPKVMADSLEMQPVLAEIVEAQASISHVQAEAARARGDCSQQKLELTGVLRAERDKVERRAAEVARCGSIHVQKQWLERMVASHCPAH